MVCLGVRRRGGGHRREGAGMTGNTGTAGFGTLDLDCSGEYTDLPMWQHYWELKAHTHPHEDQYNRSEPGG